MHNNPCQTIIFLLLFLFGAQYSNAQNFCEFEQKIFPSVAEDLMGVGRSDAIATYGDYAVLGAYGESGNGSGAGAAFVYQRCGDSWSEIQRLAPDDLEPGNRFGRGVAMWGDYMIIGTPHDDDQGTKSGSAYIYHLEDGQWVLFQKILAVGGGSSDWFGSTVGMWEDYVIIGAQYDYISMGLNGSAYIYKLQGDNWVFKKKLQASDLGANDKFGFAVDIRDNLAIVGAFQNDDLGENSGAAYVFKEEGDDWVFQNKLLPSIGAAGDNFGYAVSISEHRALVASPYLDTDSVDPGGVFVFKADETDQWVEESILYSPEDVSAENFGISLDQDGNNIIVGTVRGDGISHTTGAVYLFTESGGVWDYQSKYFADDGDHADFYGSAVYLKGDNLIVGSLGDDSNAGNAGSAYIYHIGCLPVCTKLLNPAEGSILYEEVDTLTWANVSMADGFMLGIGSDQGLYDILALQDVGDTTSYVVNLNGDNDYYITLQPYNSEGTMSTCDFSLFSLDLDVPPACLTVVEPSGNVVDFTSDISWSSVPGALGYTISVGTTSGGTEIANTVDVGISTSYDPGDLPALTDIFVNIIAYNEFGNASGCQEFQFQTGTSEPPTCIVSIEPSGEMVDVDSDITWDNVEGAVGYVLSVGTTSQGVDIIDSMNVGLNTSFEPGALPGLTQIYVNVWAYNELGQQEGCSEFIFTTGPDMAPVCLTEIVPSGEGVDYNSNISWNAIPGAIGYEITVGTTPGGNDIADQIDLGLATEYDPGPLPQWSNIYVNILGYNQFGSSDSCVEFQFQTGPNAVLDLTNDSHGFTVYPNPNSDGNITIEINDLSTIEEVYLIDVTGRIININEWTVNNEESIIRIQFSLSKTLGYYSLIVKSRKANYQAPILFVD